MQRNDSLWLDVGLKPFQWNGKTVKALVAPLVADLDGRLNLSVAGNSVSNGQSLGTGGAHASFAGYGPWEINPAALLPAGEAQQIVNARLGGTSLKARNGDTVKYFRSTPLIATKPEPMPSYSQIYWHMAGTPSFQTPASASYPASLLLTGLPKYAGYNPGSFNPVYHPSLFNPAEWPAVGRGAAGGDVPAARPAAAVPAVRRPVRRLQPMNLACVVPGTLKGSNPAARNDAGIRSAWTSPHSAPGLACRCSRRRNSITRPPAPTRRGRARRTRPPSPVPPRCPGGVAPNLPLFAGAAIPTTPATARPPRAADQRGQNMLAALGGVDLNRPLADYRTDMSNPSRRQHGQRASRPGPTGTTWPGTSSPGWWSPPGPRRPSIRRPGTSPSTPLRTARSAPTPTRNMKPCGIWPRWPSTWSASSTTTTSRRGSCGIRKVTSAAGHGRSSPSPTPTR